MKVFVMLQFVVASIVIIVQSMPMQDFPPYPTVTDAPISPTNGDLFDRWINEMSARLALEAIIQIDEQSINRPLTSDYSQMRNSLIVSVISDEPYAPIRNQLLASLSRQQLVPHVLQWLQHFPRQVPGMLRPDQVAPLTRELIQDTVVLARNLLESLRRKSRVSELTSPEKNIVAALEGIGWITDHWLQDPVRRTRIHNLIAIEKWRQTNATPNNPPQASTTQSQQQIRTLNDFPETLKRSMHGAFWKRLEELGSAQVQGGEVASSHPLGFEVPRRSRVKKLDALLAAVSIASRSAD